MKYVNFCIVLSLLALTHNCRAQDHLDTLKVLFVGNSYTYFSNLPQMVSLISDSTDTKLITEKSTAGGARLSQHWKGERGLTTMEKIKEGRYDIVVLQEQSMGTIEQPDSFLLYAKKLSEFIQDQGAKPFFYGTWAREKVPQYQETITKAYLQAAQQNHAGVALVGEAWSRAKALRPDMDLYTSDGSHPSSLGAFLTACVFVEALTGQTPKRLRSRYLIMDAHGESVLLMHQDPLDIVFCLKVVRETGAGR